jgi:hypothetical protein
MRRRGATNAIKRAREDMVEVRTTFHGARKKLNEILKTFSFVSVIEITQVPARDGKPSFYHGIGLTHFSNRSRQTERVFFDKGGRLRYEANLEIGPCKLLDAAWGRDHITAVPQIGDLLVGLCEDNLKTGKKIAKVLRGWSRHGTILLELARMVEFGTSVQENDIPKIMRQKECLMQSMLPNGESNPNVLKFIGADDFCALAKIILWGNIRILAVLHSIQTVRDCKVMPSSMEIAIAGELKLSCSAFDFVSSLSFKLEDPEIMKTFMNELVEQHFGNYGRKTPPPDMNYLEEFKGAPPSPPFKPASPHAFAPPSPPYRPSSPPPSPPYRPSSPPKPPYRPSSPPSPPYKPSSPIAPPSPPYRPNSPMAPPSPPYRPKSPPQAETPLNLNFSAPLLEEGEI